MWRPRPASQMSRQGDDGINFLRTAYPKIPPRRICASRTGAPSAMTTSRSGHGPRFWTCAAIPGSPTLISKPSTSRSGTPACRAVAPATGRTARLQRCWHVLPEVKAGNAESGQPAPAVPETQTRERGPLPISGTRGVRKPVAPLPGIPGGGAVWDSSVSDPVPTGG